MIVKTRVLFNQCLEEEHVLLSDVVSQGFSFLQSLHGNDAASFQRYAVTAEYTSSYRSQDWTLDEQSNT